MAPTLDNTVPKNFTSNGPAGSVVRSASCDVLEEDTAASPLKRSAASLSKIDDMEPLMRPVPFITLTSSETESPASDGEQSSPSLNFTVNPAACSMLEAIEAPIAVIACAGLYRTGKSFILNRLSGEGSGFSVGNRVEACTQGIYLWVLRKSLKEILGKCTDDKDGIVEKTRDCTVILLDTEGLASYSRSKSHDAKVFSLAILLSSLFIYNSVGTIDDTALDRLSFVAEISSIMQMKTQQSGSDEWGYKSVFPKFLWLLRDFGLKLEYDGKPITCDEYLDNVLKPLEEHSEKTKSRNAVRNSLKTHFSSRHCFALKRPVNDETLLQNLQTLPESQFRPVFLEQFRELMRLVYTSVEPKQIGHTFVSGRMLSALAVSYVNAINAGSVPVITSAWEGAMRADIDVFMSRQKLSIESKYQDLASRSEESGGLPAEEFESTLATIMNETVLLSSRKFECLNATFNKQELLSSLITKINEESIRARQENQKFSFESGRKKLYSYQNELMGGGVNGDEDSVESLFAKLRKFVNEKYRNECKGPAASDALADFFLTKMEPSLNKLITSTLASKESETRAHYEKRLDSFQNDRNELSKLVSELGESFSLSRKEVESLAAENTKLLGVITRFSDL